MVLSIYTATKPASDASRYDRIVKKRMRLCGSGQFSSNRQAEETTLLGKVGRILSQQFKFTLREVKRGLTISFHLLVETFSKIFILTKLLL